MKGRDKLFFNLLTFLMLVVLVLIGYQTREVDKQIKRWQTEMQRREERGMQDPQLKEVVDKLEAELQVRMQETFKLEPDPLDLVRVIKDRDFLARMGAGEMAESDNIMRLSCTVLSENSASAIIRYRGRNHVLVVGDKIGPQDYPYRVTDVGENTITLVRGSEKMVLLTEKAPDTKAAEEARTEKGKEPVVEVKRVMENY